MKQNILSKIDLYYGNVDMPKNFDIDRNQLKNDIKKQLIDKKEFSFSKTLDMYHTYLREYFFLYFNRTLINKNDFGYLFNENETSLSLQSIDPLDLRNSPDYVLLYGVDVDCCKIRIDYEDNRRKNRNWIIPLKNNSYVMFPSTQRYYIMNNDSKQKNYILSTTFTYV